MRKFILCISLICVSFAAKTQVLIDSTDMPFPGQITLRLTGNSLTGFDYQQTGQNFFWDFSTLSSTVIAGDTFISVLSTPITYNIVFSNPFDPERRATVASPQSLPPQPGIQISDAYNFLKNSYYNFSQVGIGASINGFPMPASFDHPDIWYSFPIIYGNTDSSRSEFGFNVPNLGYYGQKRSRVNLVDGWGSIYLPGDTLPVVRVKSIVKYFDSVYVDSLSFGLGFNRTETEYKWLSKGYRLPVFQVTVRSGGMGGSGLTYWYHQPGLSAGISEAIPQKILHVWPNPADNQLNFACFGGELPVRMLILDAGGKEVMSLKLSGQECTTDISALTSGVYFFIEPSGKSNPALFIKK